MFALRRLLIPISLLPFLLLAGCTLPAGLPANSPGSTPGETLSSPTMPPNAAYTAAAETIVAQLTQISQDTGAPVGTGLPGNPDAETPLPTPTSILTLPATPVVAPTDTLGPPSATLQSSDTPTPAGAQTPTTTPAPGTSPTAGQEPSATSVSGDPKQGLGEPHWQDSFDNGLNWPLYNDEHINMQVKDGALEMVALKTDKWESWMLTSQVATNFYVELIASPQECSGLDRYGLLARAQSANETYVYTFSCNGQYALRIWDGEKFISLVPWTASPAIQAGADQTNRLGFWAQDETIRLYANGALLTEIGDSRYPDGRFGLTVGAASTPEFTVSFDQMAYWILR